MKTALDQESEGLGIFQKSTAGTSGKSQNILDRMGIIILGNVGVKLGNEEEAKVL